MKYHLAGILLVALVLRLFFFAGLRGSDDLRYAELALASGKPDLSWALAEDDFAALRPGFTSSVSGCLKVGGVSEAALMAYPMLCSLGLTALVYEAARRWLGEGPALASGLLAAGVPGFVTGASSLYPDIPMVFWSTLAFFLLWGSAGPLASLGAGLAFAFAVTHKETAVLLLPAFAWLALTRSRRSLALLSLAAALALAWDGYLPRLVLQHVGNTARASLGFSLNPTLETASSLPRRLGWDFLSMLVDPTSLGGFWMWGGAGLLAAGGAWLGFRSRSLPLQACVAWALLAFLALNFAGIPGPNYFPMHPVSPRYLVLCMPPLVLLGGAFLSWAWARLGGRMRSGLAAAALVVVFGANLVTAEPNRAYARGLRTSVATLREQGASEVWTDRRTAAGLRIFLGDGVRSHELGDGLGVPEGGHVVLNGPMLALLSKYGNPLPDCLASPPPGWRSLSERQVLGLRPSGDPKRKLFVYRRQGMGMLAAAFPGQEGGQDPRAVKPRQRVVAALMALGLLVFTFELVRRRRLREEYSWLWMLAAAVILFFALYYPALVWVTDAIGAGLPTSTLFLFGLFFLILICIQYAVKISTLTMQLKNLHQELSILREKLERKGGA